MTYSLQPSGLFPQTKQDVERVHRGDGEHVEVLQFLHQRVLFQVEQISLSVRLLLLFQDILADRFLIDVADFQPRLNFMGTATADAGIPANRATCTP